VSEPYRLHLDSFGRLVFTGPDGVAHENVEAVRAFPITSPEENVSLLAENGEELAWIESIGQLSEPNRSLVREKLAGREFMPEIRRIVRVSTFATPSVWRVETDRGETDLQLKAEEDIRRLAHPALLILDGRGVHFLIRDPQALDAASRKFLDRFM
jgi:hypothetical protein